MKSNGILRRISKTFCLFLTIVALSMIIQFPVFAGNAPEFCSDTSKMCVVHYQLDGTPAMDTRMEADVWEAVIAGFYSVGSGDIDSVKAIMSEQGGTWWIQASASRYFQGDVLFIPKSTYFSGEHPMMKKETFNLGQNVTRDTGYETDFWEAMIGGFDIEGDGDLEAVEAYMTIYENNNSQNPLNGNWWIQSGAGTQTDSNTVDVLFLNRDFENQITHIGLSADESHEDTHKKIGDKGAVMAGFYIVGHGDIAAAEAYLTDANYSLNDADPDNNWWVQVGAGSDTRYNECDVWFIDPDLVNIDYSER